MEKNINGVPLIPYGQPGGVFYACVLPAAAILPRLEIRRRSEDPVTGIQRDDNLARIRDIGQYAQTENAIFPTPIIVSARSNAVTIQDGTLTILDEFGSIGHVLDGQHRVLGLKSLPDSDLAQYELLVVFVFDIDVYSEATIFSTINGNQKQVSKSLMYDLFALNPGRSVEKSCHEIVRSLNDDSGSPFYRRIKILGKKMGAEETLSQAAFVDQLRRQVKNSNSPLLKFYESGEDWAIRKIVANCFSAIDRAQEDAKPSEIPNDYFYRTTGFGGVMQSLSELVQKGEAEGDVSQDFFLRVMRRFFERTHTAPQGVGNSAMLEIKSSLLSSASEV
jgi:DGQHR domain-containing protein